MEQNKSERVMIRLDKNTRDQIKKLAEKEKVTESRYYRHIIDTYLRSIKT